MRLIVAVLALSIAASASAAVYKWVQPDGTVTYSDRAPQENAAPTDLPELQEIKLPPPPPPQPTDSSEDTPSDQAQRREYTKFEITEPANNSAFRNNAGQVTVKLNLEPALQEGDMVAILLDGKEIGQGKSNALSLSNVDRGSHTLSAMVKNAQGGTVISANPVTFTLQRISQLQSKPRS